MSLKIFFKSIRWKLSLPNADSHKSVKPDLSSQKCSCTHMKIYLNALCFIEEDSYYTSIMLMLFGS